MIAWSEGLLGLGIGIVLPVFRIHDIFEPISDIGCLVLLAFIPIELYLRKLVRTFCSVALN